MDRPDTITTIESAEGTIGPTDPNFLAVVTDLTDEQKARLTSFVKSNDKKNEPAPEHRVARLEAAEGTIY